MNCSIEDITALLEQTWTERHKDIEKTRKDIQKELRRLRSQQDQVMKTLLSSNSEVVKTKLEEALEKLEKDIHIAESQQPNEELNRHKFNVFIRQVGFLLEHLEDLLVCSQKSNLKEALFDLIFEAPPTWEEIKVGTPKISLILQQKRTSQNEKSLVVQGKFLDWNTLRDSIKHFDSVFEQFNLRRH